MNRKLKKFVKDLNRFFFDYFANRIGGTPRNFLSSPEATKKSGLAHGDILLPPNFTFERNVHPWVQVARMFSLRSGATTGHPDQSLLVCATELMDLLSYVFWIAHGFGVHVRLYTLVGSVEIDIDRHSLLSIKKIEQVYKSIYKKPDFVIELLGEFDNNIAAHIHIYDRDAEGCCLVRSSKAYVKRCLGSRFSEIYPSIIEKSDDWAIGTPWPVDIVYTWVNHKDSAWIEMWNGQFPDRPVDADRFSSKDELRYSLRAICKYLPWFHKVHIVSNCSRPSWLKNHPRINWVSHEDIFPQHADLPTFNSHAIEACLHRIPGLSERFIYFNDDVFVAHPCYYSDFYDQSGRSISQLETYGMVAAENLFDETATYLTSAMNCRARLLESYPQYQATKLHKHTPYVLLKSVLESMEKEFSEDFEYTRSQRLRSFEDFNVTSFFYHHYALATGRAVEGNAPYMIVRPRNISTLIEKANFRKYKYLCFNDGDGSATDGDFVQAFSALMTKNLPFKSSFEIDFASWSSIRSVNGRCHATWFADGKNTFPRRDNAADA